MSGKRVNLRTFDILNHDCKEIWFHIDQPVDVPGFDRDVDPAHVENLKKRLLHFGWDCRLCSVSATLLADKKKSLRAVLCTDGIRDVLKEGFSLGVVDDSHRRNVIRDIKEEFY